MSIFGRKDSMTDGIKSMTEATEAWMKLELQQIKQPYEKKAVKREAESFDLMHRAQDLQAKLMIMDHYGSHIPGWDTMSLNKRCESIEKLMTTVNRIADIDKKIHEDEDAQKPASSVLIA